MLVKALTSFAGLLSMSAGEIREVDDKELVKDLMNAGYIEEIKEAETKKPTKKK